MSKRKAKQKLKPIGYIGVTNKKNLQDHELQKVPANIPFKIVNYSGVDKMPYVVQFLDKRWYDLNDDGPYLTDNCINDDENTIKTVRVLYGC